MSQVMNINFNILNEYIEEKCGGKEYYLGCWAPEQLTINHDEIPENIQFEKGANWFALRNGADRTNGLIFPANSDADPQLTLFRGYLSEASIHSYSPAEQVRKYWSQDLNRRHNGIFSVVRISQDGSQLSLVSDIFGISPIFHRQIGDVILFASAPGLISQPFDNPNKISWVLRSIYGYVPGKETLVEEVESIIPASIKTFSNKGIARTRWYDHKNFPSNTSVFDEDAMAKSEAAFSLAIKRCAAIKHGDQIIPLTSGCDSRRILAHLMDQCADFKATTVTMPEPTGEDVDSLYSALIANDYELDHSILKMPSAEQWRKDEKQKVFSFDAQSSAHTWSVDMFRQHAGQNACFYDGLGGDIFVHWPWSLEVDTIDKAPQKIPDFFNAQEFPPLELVHWRLKDVRMPASYGDNRALFTSLLMSTKNNTALWAQQQTLPGHITFCPYFDLDYIEVMVNYIVDEYEETYPQQLILAKFWPELSKYPNSRDFEEDIVIKETPEGVKNIGDDRRIMQDKADLDILNESFKACARKIHYDDVLSIPARIAIRAARYIPAIRKRISWWLVYISQIVLWWQSRPYVIEIVDDED